MKISLDIDCTPDELRGFFGMPDVKPMQERLLKEVEERMRADLKALDPENRPTPRALELAVGDHVEEVFTRAAALFAEWYGDGLGRAQRVERRGKTLHPETMLKTWLPAGLKGFEQLQEMFISQLGQMSGRGAGKK